MAASTRSEAEPPEKIQSVCVLVSGGLDSCVLVAEMGRTRREVHPVFIRQGLRWEETEIHWLRRFLEALRAEPLNLRSIREITLLDLPAGDLYGEHWSTTGENVPGAETEDAAVYLPGRNVLLLAKTAVFCAMRGIPEIALGILGQNPFPDATPEFFSKMEETLSTALNAPIRLTRPFAGQSKKAVTEMGRGLPLELSFSCIDPEGMDHCGVCNKCDERRKGFREAGIEDRTVYATTP